jgi:putative hydrolase of HD superfamily
MCRMALMAMMIPNDGERPLDLPRCVMASCFKILMKIPNDALLQMALVHDLAEAQSAFRV